MGKQRNGKPRPGKPFPAASEKRSLPRRFLLPSIMLLLSEEPSHGYALLEKLVEMGAAEKRLPLPIIYRALAYLEVKKMATARLVKTEGRGPVKKVFRLTEKGWKELASWSESMKNVRDFIGEFQSRYESSEKARKEKG